MMTFHVCALPHTQTTKEYSLCAYTQKIVNFCLMMKSLGHKVYLYASEDNDAPCDELITCITKDQQKKLIPQNDWKKDFFSVDWQGNFEYWRAMNLNAIRGITLRAKKNDFICLIGGDCQKLIADAFPEMISVEFGIGYRGIFSKYRVFESYAWMHYIYGLTNQRVGNNFDAVINNYYDVKDFPFERKKSDYFLYVGRCIKNKGLELAHETSKRLGVRLLVAGQGVKDYSKGKIVIEGLTLQGDNLEYLGTLDVKTRGELMSKARALFVPTQYIGPFEGVHAEAMLCGTPVITSDWGVFNETVLDGINGFRVRTLGEAIWAANETKELDHRLIRKLAIDKFSTNVIRHRYQAYFEQLETLWGEGWYEEKYSPFQKRHSGFFI